MALPYVFTDSGNPPILSAQVNANFDAVDVGFFNAKSSLYGAVGNGVVDDTAAINSAISAANAAGGGIVILPDGTYLVGSRSLLVASVYTCIILLPGVILRGASRTGTVIQLANSVESCVIAGNGCNDAGVDNLTINGNRSNQTESGQDGNQCGLFIYESNRPIIRNVSIINAQRQGYYDSINTWARIDNLYAYNCGCEGFSLSNSFYGLYENIIVNACGVNAGVQGNYHSGVYVNGGAIENTVVNVYSQNNGGFGFSLSSDAGSTDCVDNTFVGVTSVGNPAGVYIGSSAASTFVARNRFYNLVSRLDATAATNNAITLYQANDNYFSGCMAYNAKNGAGVYLVSSSNNRFESYEAFDNQATHTQTYGILEGSGCAENLFVNPVFEGGFTGAAYSLTTSVVAGAVGATNFLRPVTPTLLNGWTVYSGATPTYERDANNLIRIHGIIASGTLGSPAFVLPVGARPASDMYLATASNGAYGELYIQASTGNVTPLSGSNVYFSLECVPVYSGH